MQCCSFHFLNSRTPFKWRQSFYQKNPSHNPGVLAPIGLTSYFTVALPRPPDPKALQPKPEQIPFNNGNLSPRWLKKQVNQTGLSNALMCWAAQPRHPSPESYSKNEWDKWKFFCINLKQQFSRFNLIDKRRMFFRVNICKIFCRKVWRSKKEIFFSPKEEPFVYFCAILVWITSREVVATKLTIHSHLQL